jgi:hypothetical protein
MFGGIGFYSGGFYHPKNIFICFNSGGNMPSLTCPTMNKAPKSLITFCQKKHILNNPRTFSQHHKKI